MEKTGLDQAINTRFVSSAGSRRHAPGLEDDARWHLAQRIVDSPQFCKSPRLSQFLLYVVGKTLEGRQSEISEQQIGVHVFGRPHGYRTVDDNIVRSYARLLRRRLTEYFASDGIRWVAICRRFLLRRNRCPLTSRRTGADWLI
jgi:hypothetical protein